MSLFASLALVSGAIMTGLVVRRKPKVHLINALIDGEPKPATLLPPATQQAFTRFQELVQDLFGDTRQQYQQALNTNLYGGC